MEWSGIRGESVKMADGTWWIYDPVDRSWCPIGDAPEGPTIPNRPDVVEVGEDPGWCPTCGRCFCCGGYVEETA